MKEYSISINSILSVATKKQKAGCLITKHPAMVNITNKELFY